MLQALAGADRLKRRRNLSDLSDSDIALHMFIVCRHQLMPK